ncbi:Outer membrane receptor proteins, mostly Fe transport [Dyadobacter sp. SG02]|uniref:outer membrane beta-barrel protein n=1 Tax=Dyadobacter sp. SG02 TaxID=1855291 RepID=UPI0008BB9A5C|nr:outer membrane beta-barrel protein [Dyadobacter sp. SG02]SEI39188.1 Outer membrane receptor proteins, mostly Fe transport [Dyadobacter sp. SG02]
MKTFFTILTLCLTSLNALGQTGNTISGTVKDSGNESLPGATVRLLKATDSTLVTGETTDMNGNFRFNNLENNTYMLAISAMGQKDFKSTALTIDGGHSSIALPAIILLPAKSIELGEVVVKAKKPLIEQEIDRTIVNVDAMIGSATNNTFDVLSKTPGVSVNANGEISLNGKGGVMVLIDGRSTYMSGADLAAYLKSLPGGVLDRIELMDNPPARYDAAGNAVIDIRLKKTRTGGLTGSVALGGSQGRYSRSNDALNLNYNQRKLNLFANLGYSYEKNYSDDDFSRRYYDESGALKSRVQLKNDQKSAANGYNINLGMDLAATSKTVFGTILNFNGSSRKGDFSYESAQRNALNALINSGNGSTVSKDTRNNTSINLNMLHKLNDKGRELAMDANYLNYHTRGTQDLENRLFDENGSTASRELFRYRTPSEISIYTLKADYAHPLKNKARLEAGFKSSYVDNDFVFNYYNTNDGSAIIDNRRSNHFQYRENINAAYVSGEKRWKRFGVQMGLRLENTVAKGNQLGNDSVLAMRFTKNYTKLFPSIFLNYKLNEQNAFVLMAVRRISRPNYQMLNPFVFYKDQYTYSAGNPHLIPQYQDRLELKYQHKHFLNMGLSYNRFTNTIFTTIQAQGDTFTSRPDNIARGYMVLLNTSISGQVTSWWYNNTTLRLSRITMKGPLYTEALNYGTNVARLELNNYFNLGNGWNAEFGGYYASRDLNGQAQTSGMFRVNGGIQKKIWKGKGAVALNFEDLFHSWVYHNRSFSIRQSDYSQVNRTDTQRINIALNYKFGKETFARKRRHNNNASDDEKGRVE